MDIRSLKIQAAFLVAVLFFSAPLAALTPGADAASPARTVYFSAITLYHPIVMYQRYQPLMDYLSRNTPYRFELKLSQDYRDIINFLKTNKVQVALLGGVTYLEAKKEFAVIPILKPLGPDGKPFYRCVLITKSTNSKINSLSDVKGRSVAFGPKLSTSGTLAPFHHLYSSGITIKDLSGHRHFKYHDSVAREVLRGNFDAGFVIDAVANRFEDRGIRIVDVSEPIPGLPFVVRADASKDMINAVKKALLALDYNNPAHREIMSAWDEEFKYGFSEAEDTDYNPVRRMIEFLGSEGIRIP